MKKAAAALDDRQTMIPLDLPPGPRLSSDEKARGELLAMVETLAASRQHPWSARLLGWQVRRFNALKQMLTPLDAVALSARFDAELERLGAPLD
jgi:Ser/Thr protein kinase RdoA (MazF antagonist)